MYCNDIMVLILKYFNLFFVPTVNSSNSSPVSSLLYRAACCFNLFFIVPTHALHYTLKY